MNTIFLLLITIATAIPCFARDSVESNAPLLLASSLTDELNNKVAILIDNKTRCKVVAEVKVEKRPYRQLHIMNWVEKQFLADRMVDVFVLRASKEVCSNGVSRVVYGQALLPFIAGGKIESGTPVQIAITY